MLNALKTNSVCPIQAKIPSIPEFYQVLNYKKIEENKVFINKIDKQ